ncbi:potential cytoplasmic adenylate kinase [Pseudozyma hubeiensis SY62]|uniref:Potential cytoplasmic adenylate kinase n=1 Tax=Pseudozyma hubeiensis (strain SY62) TaxID=1305764 RepID=R9NZV2_PSEHS|nr:potential cytoplasmic adenylate kinase [Pseudozyma hubeiensis SY62]GAC94433.1 potential cytoplasmic adenylate kinase [Pseudozyma hubeiensis SY62]
MATPSVLRTIRLSPLTTTSIASCSRSRSFTTSTTLSSASSQMRMLIVGSPGSGKGTQSTRLLSHFSFTILSAGDVLRSHISRGTEIGQRADSVIKSGSLMPDDIMMSLIGSSITSLSSSDWLLDGFPRTLGQAQMLDTMLSSSSSDLELVVNLDVPEEIILDRILNRWTHLPSGRVYNLTYNPPKTPGKDDITGEPLSKRQDDNVETFANRLKSFHKQTEPMLQHYREKSGSILDIDCRVETDPESVEEKGELFVNLRGDTSNQIWPHLLKIVRGRFPHLKPSQSSA